MGSRCWEHNDGCLADFENQVPRHKGFLKFPILNPPHPPVIGTKSLDTNFKISGFKYSTIVGVLIKPLKEGFSILTNNMLVNATWAMTDYSWSLHKAME